MLFILMAGMRTVQSFRMAHYKIAYALNSGNRGASAGAVNPGEPDGAYFAPGYFARGYFATGHFGGAG